MISLTVAEWPTGREVSGWLDIMSRLARGAGQRFHKNVLSQLGADGEARVANEADEVAGVLEERDLLILAQAQLAQAAAHIRRRGKPFDAHRRAHDDAIQRANKRLGAAAIAGAFVLALIHAGQGRRDRAGRQAATAATALVQINSCPMARNP